MVGSAAFRLLICFFQHPSFHTFIDQIWLHITTHVIEGEANIRKRMTISFWDYEVDELLRLVSKDREILSLAKTSNMIDDYYDAPIFLYAYYHSSERQAIDESLKAICSGQVILTTTL